MFRRTLWPLAVIVTLLFAAGCSESADTGEPQPHRTDPQTLAEAGPPDDQYIIELAPGTDAREIADNAAAAHAIKVGHVYGAALNGFTFRGSETAAKQLARRPDVKRVVADLPVDISQQTLPPGIDRIEADQNATASIDGTDTRVDVDVAILDTGVDASHPDLNVYQQIDCVGGNGCAPGGTDIHGHGTHVSGTVAALDNNSGVVGVAPGARIHAIKVLEPGVYASIGDVIAGLDWVVANAPEVDVINMSLGGSGCMSPLRTAVQSAVNSGIFVAVAAGNSAMDISGNGTYGDCDDTIPAAYPEAAAISAMVDTDGAQGGNGSNASYGDDDSFASFSNYSNYNHSSNPVNSPGAGIDLMLPGASIMSTCTGGTYCLKSGTSMASPHAAGLAALYYATYGDQSDAAGVYAVRQALIDGAAAQTSSSGLATLDDPDSNPEPIGLASFSGSTSDPEPQPEPEPDPTTTPELTPSSQSALAGPSQTVTYQFSLCNAGNSLGSYANSTAASWPSSVTPTSVSGLSAGACATLDVSHTIPSATADGATDRGTLTVDSGSETATASFETTADAPSWAVRLDPTQQMGSTSPGSAMSYSFNVCNDGNRADSYTLSTSSTWTASLAPTSISNLSPGGCQSVTVSHTAPSTSQDGDSDAGMLTVASANASATATFDTVVEAPTYAVNVGPDPQMATGGPGEAVSYDFTVCNDGNRSDSYSLTTGSIWSTSVSPTSLSNLAAGSCQTATVTHNIPSTSLDGDFDSGTVYAQSANATASAQFDTTVSAPSYAVSIGPNPQMAFGAPGDALSYDYTVCNDGNRSDSYSLTTTSTWSASVSPTSLSALAAGSCQTVTVTHTLPSTGQDGDIDTGTLTATSANASATASFESTVDAPAPAPEPEPAPEPLSVTDMTPDTVRAGNSVTVSISGTGFTSGITAEFVGGRGRNPRVQSLSVDDANTISATVSTKSGGPRGSRIFDLVLTDSTGMSVVLPGALVVTR